LFRPQRAAEKAQRARSDCKSEKIERLKFAFYRLQFEVQILNHRRHIRWHTSLIF
jgi:hypothetical protein